MRPARAETFCRACSKQISRIEAAWGFGLCDQCFDGGRAPAAAAAPARRAFARQIDGHPEVVVKDAPASTGGIVTKVPNGEPVTVLSEDSEYTKIEWRGTEGYVRT